MRIWQALLSKACGSSPNDSEKRSNGWSLALSTVESAARRSSTGTSRKSTPLRYGMSNR
ncbi:hypothetical protein D3C86_2259840 [compost metagenome]